MPQNSEVARRAADCATDLATLSSTDPQSATSLLALLNAIRALGPRYAFERDGREGAIAAVRAALPAIERDLFDAIVEDHACEIAALSEAVAQVARSRAHD
jgi:hypothetical protein